MAKEIISKFKERPKTKIAWWAIGLSSGAILGFFILDFFGYVMFHDIFFTNAVHKLDPNEQLLYANSFEMSIAWMFALILSIAAITLGIISLNKGERSWILWIGFILAILVVIPSALMLWYSSFWLSILEQKGIFVPDNNMIKIIIPDKL